MVVQLSGKVRTLTHVHVFDDSVIKDNRQYLRDILAEVQHELFTGFSVSAGYNRNWIEKLRGGGQPAQEFHALDDNDAFCITVPNDPNLLNAGQEQCGYYDLNPAKCRAGARSTGRDSTDSGAVLGSRRTLSLDGRFPNGASLDDGVDIGNQVQDFCYNSLKPPGLRGGIGEDPSLRTLLSNLRHSAESPGRGAI